MEQSITLNTFPGGIVTPQYDAIVRQTAIPSSGLFKGGDVSARGCYIHVSEGFGMIRGRFFKINDTEITVPLSADGKLKKGCLYIHLDLSNADEPIKLVTSVSDALPVLSVDNDLNYNNSVFDLSLAEFAVTAIDVENLVHTVGQIQPSGQDSGQIGRSQAYVAGEYGRTETAPGWVTFVCTTAGTTASTEPTAYAGVAKVGDTVTDGKAVFTARNLYGELNTAQNDISSLKEQTSTSGAVNLKTLSLSEYISLSSYNASTIYLVYEGSDKSKITRIYVGKQNTYTTGADVTYHIGSKSTTMHLYYGADAILQAPDAAQDGMTFEGWSKNIASEGAEVILKSCPVNSETAIVLYAVLRKGTDVTYNIDSDNTVTVHEAYGTDMILAAPKAVKNGYTFDGWRKNVKASTDDLVKSSVTGIETKDTLYAVFAGDQSTVKVSLSFNPDGATETKPMAQVKPAGSIYCCGTAVYEPVTVPACTYTKTGMMMDGWSIDGKTVVCSPGDSYTLTANVMFLPTWFAVIARFTSGTSKFTAPRAGIYQISAYGAAGWNIDSSTWSFIPQTAEGGKGGHTSGRLIIASGAYLDITAGAMDKTICKDKYTAASVAVSAAGGGKTVVKSGNTTITVAGGGGGAGALCNSSTSTYYTNNGGAGGGTTAGSGEGKGSTTANLSRGGNIIINAIAGKGGYPGSDFNINGKTLSNFASYAKCGDGYECGGYGFNGGSSGGGTNYIAGFPKSVDGVYSNLINEQGINPGDGYVDVELVGMKNADGTYTMLS